MARSKEIAPSVGRLSRSQVAAKRGLHKGECWCEMGVGEGDKWRGKTTGEIIGRTGQEQAMLAGMEAYIGRRGRDRRIRRYGRRLRRHAECADGRAVANLQERIEGKNA